jgi:hypothetical protein
MSKKTQDTQRPYTKPRLRGISLAGEEVFAPNCKSATQAPISGDSGNSPVNCLVPTACNLDGS